LFSIGYWNRGEILYELPIHRVWRGGKEEGEAFFLQGVSLCDKGIDQNDASLDFKFQMADFKLEALSISNLKFTI
jgi:hypothetical protein